MSTPEIEFAQQIPLIDSGIANIKLGIYNILFNRYLEKYGREKAAPLAYCVNHRIFNEPLDQSTLEKFEHANLDIVNGEFENAYLQLDLKDAFLLAYAVKIMVLGWRTHNPFNDEANKLTTLATEHYAEIPNIVQMWGSQAVLKFFQYSTNFASKALSGK